MIKEIIIFLIELLGIKMNFKLKQEYKSLSETKLYDLFIQKMKKIKSSTSITGKKYKIIQVDENITFKRESTDKIWKLQQHEIIEMFKFIKKTKFNITSLHDNKIVQRKQSPTTAFLISTEMIDKTI